MYIFGGPPVMSKTRPPNYALKLEFNKVTWVEVEPGVLVLELGILGSPKQGNTHTPQQNASKIRSHKQLSDGRRVPICTACHHI